MATPTVDPTHVPLAELVVRAGDAHDPAARRAMQGAYLRVDKNYPDAIGLSCLYRVGASLDELAREGSSPHGKLSYSIVAKIVRELAGASYAPVLYVTPAPLLHLLGDGK